MERGGSTPPGPLTKRVTAYNDTQIMNLKVSALEIATDLRKLFPEKKHPVMTIEVREGDEVYLSDKNLELSPKQLMELTVLATDRKVILGRTGAKFRMTIK